MVQKSRLKHSTKKLVALATTCRQDGTIRSTHTYEYDREIKCTVAWMSCTMTKLDALQLVRTNQLTKPFYHSPMTRANAEMLGMQ